MKILKIVLSAILISYARGKRKKRGNKTGDKVQRMEVFFSGKKGTKNHKEIFLKIPEDSMKKINIGAINIYLGVRVEHPTKIQVFSIESKSQKKLQYFTRKEDHFVAQITKDEDLWKEIYNNNGTITIKIQNLMKNSKNKIKLSFQVSNFVTLRKDKVYDLKLRGSNSIRIRVKGIKIFSRRNLFKTIVYTEDKYKGHFYGVGNFRRKYGKIQSKIVKEFSFTQFDKGLLGFDFSLKDKEGIYCKRKVCELNVLLKFDHGGVNKVIFGTFSIKRFERIGNKLPQPSILPRRGVRYFYYESKSLNDVIVTLEQIKGLSYLGVQPGMVIRKKGGLEIQTVIDEQFPIQKIFLSSENQKKRAIKVKSRGFAAFTVKAESLKHGKVTLIHDSSLFEEINSLEMKTYFLPFDFKDEDKYSFRIEVESKVPEIKMFLKECYQFGLCEVQKEDIKSGKLEEGKKDPANKLLQIINHKVICSKKEKVDVPEGYKLSRSCLFSLAVVAPKMKSVGRFNVRILRKEGSHKLVHSNFRLVDLEEKEKETYHAVVLKESSVLTLIIDFIFGDAELCIMKGTAVQHYPKEPEKSCISLLKFDSKIPGPKNLKFIPINLNSTTGHTVQGVYFFAIKANTRSTLSIGIKKISKKKRFSRLTKLIKPGIPISERITLKDLKLYSLAKKRFNFVLNDLKDFDSINIEISSRLTNQIGIAVTNNGKDPSIFQGYWTSTTNSLKISRNDSLLDSKAESHVFFLNVFNLNEYHKKDIDFKILVSVNNQNNLLKCGEVNTGYIHNSKKCFYFHITKNTTEYLLLTKGLNSDTLVMYSSLCSNVPPSPNSYHKMASSYQIGLYYTSEEISQRCGKGKSAVAYVCLYGENNEKYNLLYTFNNQRIMLRGHTTLYIPLPKRGQRVNFLAFPNDKFDDKLSISETSESHKLALYSKCVNRDEKASLVFPGPESYEKSSFGSGVVNKISYKTYKGVKREKGIMCLFTVMQNQQSEGKLEEFPFIMNKFFRIELSLGPVKKEINEGEIVTEIFEYGEQREYFFENFDNSEQIEISVGVSGAGFCQVWVVKGISHYNRDQKYLFNGGEDQGSEILINKDLMISKGYEADLRGIYTISVLGRSKGHISVQWKNHNNPVLKPRIGHEFEIKSFDGKIKHLFVEVKDSKELDLMIENFEAGFELYVKKHSRKDSGKFGRDIINFPFFKKKSLDDGKKIFSRKVKDGEKLKVIRFRNLDKDVDLLLITLIPNSKKKFLKSKFLFMKKFHYTELHFGEKLTAIAEGQKKLKFSAYLRYKNLEKMYIDKYHQYLQIQVSEPATLTIEDMRYSKLPIADKKNWKNSLRKIILRKGFNFIDLQPEKNEPDFAKSHRANQIYRHHYKIEKKEKNSKSKLMVEITILDPKIITNIKLNTPFEGYNTHLSYKDGTTFALKIPQKISENPKNLKFILKLREFGKDNPIIQEIKKKTDNYQNQEIGRCNFLFQIFHSKKFLKKSEDFRSLKDGSKYNIEFDRDVVIVTTPISDGYYYFKIMKKMKFLLVALVADMNELQILPILGRKIVDLKRPGDEDEFAYLPSREGVLHIRKTLCYGHDIETSIERSSDYKFSPLSFKKISSKKKNLNGKFQTQISEVKIENLESVKFKVKKHKRENFEKRTRATYMKEGLTNSIFSFELDISPFNKNHPFSNIKHERIKIKIDGNNPEVKLNALKIPEKNLENWDYWIDYTLIISKDPDLVHYVKGCGEKHLDELYENSSGKFSPKNLMKIQKWKEQIGVSKGSYFHMVETEAGKLYSVSAFADITARKKSEKRGYQKIDDFELPMLSDHKYYEFRRFQYRTVTFQTSSLTTNLEILTAIIGLGSIVIVSILLVWKKVFKAAKMQMRKMGFSQIRSEVDEDLEDYILRMSGEITRQDSEDEGEEDIRVEVNVEEKLRMEKEVELQPRRKEE